MHFRRDDPDDPTSMLVTVSLDGVALRPSLVVDVDTDAGIVELRQWMPDAGEWAYFNRAGDVEVRWSHRVELGDGRYGEIGELVADADHDALVAHAGGR